MPTGVFKRSEEHKRNQSKGLLLYYKTHPEAKLGRTLQLKALNIRNQYAKGAIRSPETRKRISLGNMGSHHNHKSLTRSDTVKQLWKDKEYRRKMLESHLTYWQTDDSKKQMQSMMLGMQRRPNKPETKVLELLNTYYPRQWKYTSDGSFILDKLCPDFVNVNGKKQVIEFFGSYWHRRPNRGEIERINRYLEIGWNCLVIWDTELKDTEALKNKIRAFIGGD